MSTTAELQPEDFAVRPEYKQVIFQYLLDANYLNYTTRSHPRLVFVGGQPASGKSRLIHSVRQRLGDAFAVDSDELRKLHPQLTEISHADPLRMDVLTNEPVAEWFRSAVQTARERNINIIIENSFTQSQVLIDEGRRFLDAGYEVEYTAIATPAPVSRLGVIGRYLEAVQQGRIPRWTATSSHDNAYAAAPTVLTEILASGVVPQVSITSRDAAKVREVADPTTVAAVFTEMREKYFTKQTVGNWAQMYRTHVRSALDHKVVTDYTRDMFQDVVADAEALLSAEELPAEHAELRAVLMSR